MLRRTLCVRSQFFGASRQPIRSLVLKPFRYFSSDLRFSKDHEWVRIDSDRANVTLGITEHAQNELGEIVYVELPEVGTDVDSGEVFGSVESVKAANDLYSPVSGEVTDVNSALSDDTQLINKEAESDGWMLKVKLSKASELDDLMSKEQYEKFITSVEDE
eukprot:151598_1